MAERICNVSMLGNVRVAGDVVTGKRGCNPANGLPALPSPFAVPVLADGMRGRADYETARSRAGRLVSAGNPTRHAISAGQTILSGWSQVATLAFTRNGHGHAMQRHWGKHTWLTQQRLRTLQQGKR